MSYGRNNRRLAFEYRLYQRFIVKRHQILCRAAASCYYYHVVAYFIDKFERFYNIFACFRSLYSNIFNKYIYQIVFTTYRLFNIFYYRSVIGRNDAHVCWILWNRLFELLVEIAFALKFLFEHFKLKRKNSFTYRRNAVHVKIQFSAFSVIIYRTFCYYAFSDFRYISFITVETIGADLTVFVL